MTAILKYHEWQLRWRKDIIWYFPGILNDVELIEMTEGIFNVWRNANKFGIFFLRVVKVLFKVAKFHALNAIFIDKIDALCSQCGSDSSFPSIQIRTVLIHMDELASNIHGDDHSLEKVIMVLATMNFLRDIDEAFCRSFEFTHK